MTCWIQKKSKRVIIKPNSPRNIAGAIRFLGEQWVSCPLFHWKLTLICLEWSCESKMLIDVIFYVDAVGYRLDLVVGVRGSCSGFPFLETDSRIFFD